MSHCCQGPYPCWESQSTSPPRDALQHGADLSTCCGGSSDSNLVLFLCVQCPQLSELVHFLLWELSVTFSIFHRHSLPCWSFGFNLQAVQLVGRFWVFFLIHTAHGFQLWFYFHPCMWVVHWGLLLRLPWRTWVCPREGQVWRRCSCLGHRGSEHQVLKGAGS